MNELLKINYEAEQPTVSARDLHEALGVASRFSRWFDSNKELFVEGEDYNKCTSSTVVNNGARRELEDYSMSVLMWRWRLTIAIELILITVLGACVINFYAIR